VDRGRADRAKEGHRDELDQHVLPRDKSSDCPGWEREDVTTVERPTPIDRGTFAVTDQRALLLGRTRSVDWEFRQLLGDTHDDSGTWTALHVSNRQHLYGVGYPRSSGDKVRFYLALALALYRDEAPAFVATLEKDTLELLNSPPVAPHGVPVDGRVRRLTTTQPVDEAASTVKALGTARAGRLMVGFAEADLPILATAADLLGFIVTGVRPGSAPRNPADVDAEMRKRTTTTGKPWAAAIAGDAQFIAGYLDGLPSATLRLVAADATTLDQLGIAAIDSESCTPSEVGYGAPRRLMS
jgi:hypothetical protein